MSYTSTLQKPSVRLVARILMTLLAALVISVNSLSAQVSHASTTTTQIGPSGQRLTAAFSGKVAADSTIRVSGRGYSTDYGIYVTYCVMVPPRIKPTECGPFDITGRNNASVWISSHPPLYAALLVKPFGPGGSFVESIKVTRWIGKTDCRKTRCAIYTRADHTFPNYRKADVAIPVTLR